MCLRISKMSHTNRLFPQTSFFPQANLEKTSFGRCVLFRLYHEYDMFSVANRLNGLIDFPPKFWPHNQTKKNPGKEFVILSESRNSNGWESLPSSHYIFISFIVSIYLSVRVPFHSCMIVFGGVRTPLSTVSPQKLVSLDRRNKGPGGSKIQ